MLTVDLICGMCGETALEVVIAKVHQRGNYRARCASCGHPGEVCLDDEDDPTEGVSWVSDDDDCGFCDACCSGERE
jgi:uncharacterized Zn finger protein